MSDSDALAQNGHTNGTASVANAFAPHHVVIVGGGFAGLRAARTLRKAPVQITLIDRTNHHTFQPLLYQVATAELSDSQVAVPIRAVLRRQRNTRVLMTEVTGIDPDHKVVTTTSGPISFDSLILATGATHSYFGHDDWASVAPGLKGIEDALEIRSRVLAAFEAAEREEDPKKRLEWITFVVVGGGPTGLELSGALSEVAHKTLPCDFRRVDLNQARVILIEAAPRLLPTMLPELSDKARRQIEGLRVEVRTGTPVTEIDEHGVVVGGERIDARTVIWAAGVSASPLGRALGVPVDKAGRVLVEPDLTIPGHSDIYVVGDLASLKTDGKLVPGVAAAAIQEGQHAADNIERSLRGLPRLPFHYRNWGTLATIGRAAAVADFGRIRLSGYIAWVAWLFIHVIALVGFRNRLIVLLQWAFSYLTYSRGARLITGVRPDTLATAARSAAIPPSLPSPRIQEVPSPSVSVPREASPPAH